MYGPKFFRSYYQVRKNKVFEIHGNHVPKKPHKIKIKKNFLLL